MFAQLLGYHLPDASWGATLGIVDHHLNFWWELALLGLIMLLGHWIEIRSLDRVISAVDSLAALLLMACCVDRNWLSVTGLRLIADQ